LYFLWISFSGWEASNASEASLCLIDTHASFPSNRRICRHRNDHFIRSIITTISFNCTSRSELDWCNLVFAVIATGRFGMIPSAKETIGLGVLKTIPKSSKMGVRDPLVPFFECGLSIPPDDHEKRTRWYPRVRTEENGRSSSRAIRGFAGSDWIIAPVIYLPSDQCERIWFYAR